MSHQQPTEIIAALSIGGGMAGIYSAHYVGAGFREQNTVPLRGIQKIVTVIYNYILLNNILYILKYDCPKNPIAPSVVLAEILPNSLLSYSGETADEYRAKLTDETGVAEIVDNLIGLLQDEKLSPRELPVVWSLIIELYDVVPRDVGSQVDGFLTVRALAYFNGSTEGDRFDLNKIMAQYSHLKAKNYFADEYLAKAYAKWFLKKSGLQLSHYNEAPSKSPAEINIESPSIYKPMSLWMAEMSTAMTQGIRPDEAEAWTNQHKHEWAAGTMKVTASQTIPTTATSGQPQLLQAQPAAEAQQSSDRQATALPVVKTPASSTPWVAVAVVVFVLAAVGGFVLLRRHKNN